MTNTQQGDHETLCVMQVRGGEKRPRWKQLGRGLTGDRLFQKLILCCYAIFMLTKIKKIKLRAITIELL